MNLRPKPVEPPVEKAGFFKRHGIEGGTIAFLIFCLFIISTPIHLVVRDYNICQKNGISMWWNMCSEYKRHNKNMTFCEICIDNWQYCMDETLTKQKYEAECHKNETDLNLTGNFIPGNITSFTFARVDLSGIYCNATDYNETYGCAKPQIVISCDGYLDAVKFTKGNKTSFLNITEYCRKI